MMFGLRSEGGDSTDQAIARLSEMGITVDALALWDFGAHNECVLLSKDFNTGMHKVKGGVK
jgi:hypothetical protein